MTAVVTRHSRGEPPLHDMATGAPCDDPPVTPHPLMCAFCAETVETAGVDPCALVVVTSWWAPEEAQREQQFFCHADCLRNRLHPKVAVHAEVLDADP
jgi:hypothetical protein